MKLQSLIVIFLIIVVPIILLLSLYISNGLRTLQYQNIYASGLLSATHDALYAFEINTRNKELSSNPEIKRDIIKSSIKMFEQSLCNKCGISAYNTDEIENYIPAIVFGLYDGFYIYTPARNPQNNKYEHELKNYVFYSETLKGIGEGDSDIVIRYSLDNYVVVSGDFEGDGEGYIIKSGYLIVKDKWKGYIDYSVQKAVDYYVDSQFFTDWFNKYIGKNINFLNINEINNPENENSDFVTHKRNVIKEKMQSVLNASITAYSQRTTRLNYKMPKLSEKDWEKIYNNISMLTFFQGKSIGMVNYNGYCVLDSVNNTEYVNPNLMYFIEGDNTSNSYHHDIRCSTLKETTKTLNGYKMGEFTKQKLLSIKNSDGTIKTDGEGKILYDDNGTEVTNQYKYNYKSLACYECINGQLGTAQTVYEYINSLDDTKTNDKKIKTAYYTSLARERWNTIKLQ